MRKDCKRVIRNCETCNKEFLFQAKPSVVKRGGGRFCSRACQATGKIKSLEPRTCEYCGETFLFRATPGRLRLGYGRYCSTPCFNQGRVVPLAERFKRYVGPKEENGCILWTGSKNPGGYGTIGTDARPNSRKNGILLAHRVAYELANGPIPEGLNVLHNCPGGDNPACVNPEHLFLGTLGDNNTDRDTKGRSAKGTDLPNAKLNETRVRAIRTRYEAGGITQRQLAEEHRVHEAVICNVVNRKTWKHVN